MEIIDVKSFMDEAVPKKMRKEIATDEHRGTGQQSK
jgi:hypothetical protein